MVSVKAKINQLTPQQKASVAQYQQRWRAIALTLKPVDRQQATAAVRTASAALGIEAPEITFCQGPTEAFNAIVLSASSQQWRDDLINHLQNKLYKAWQTRQLNQQNLLHQLPYLLGRDVTSRVRQLLIVPTSLLRALTHQLRAELRAQVTEDLIQRIAGRATILAPRSLQQLEHQLGNAFKSKVANQLAAELQYQIGSFLERLAGKQLSIKATKELISILWKEISIYPSHSLHLQHWDHYACLFDFCISELGCQVSPSLWQAFQQLVQECGWMYAAGDSCLACDRPTKLQLDRETCLHALGEPALQFADSYTLYSYRGVTLPKKYGILPPEAWEPQWLLQEPNTNIKQALLQGIGRPRIFQTLTGDELVAASEQKDFKIAKLTAKQAELLLAKKQEWADIVAKLPVKDAPKVKAAVQDLYTAIAGNAPQNIEIASNKNLPERIVSNSFVETEINGLAAYLSHQLKQQLQPYLSLNEENQPSGIAAREVVKSVAESAAERCTQTLGFIMPELLLFKAHLKLLPSLEMQLDRALLDKILNDFNLPLPDKLNLDNLKNVILKSLDIALEDRAGKFLEMRIGKAPKVELINILKDRWQSCLHDAILNLSASLDFNYWQYAALFDFSVSVLDCYLPPQDWQAFQTAVKCCSEIYLIGDTCLASYSQSANLTAAEELAPTTKQHPLVSNPKLNSKKLNINFLGIRL